MTQHEGQSVEREEIKVGFVLRKTKIVVQNEPHDFFAGDEFEYFPVATMDVFVAKRELSAEFVSSAFKVRDVDDRCHCTGASRLCRVRFGMSIVKGDIHETG